jgi:glycosyltransferase involved in cell wall biosynthesis
MKIVYIVLKGMPLGGGIEKYTEEIGSRLARMGHEVIVYAMRHYGAETAEYNGMQVKTVPTVRKKYFEKLAASCIASICQCKDKDVDIVHMHAFGPAIFGYIPRIQGRKVVTQGHGLEWKRSRWNWFGRAFLRTAEKPSVWCAHALTTVSRVQQAYLKEQYGRESTYLPTGVNPPIEERPDLIRQFGLEGNDYILFSSRLVRDKGVHYLIKAYNQLDTDIKLVIAGDAQHEEKYRAELRQLANNNNKIIFPGFVTGKLLHEFFSNSYLFVQPSEIEGLPTALLEAMSYGNCVLASDIPENREALNGYGYTFYTTDVNSLTQQLEYLISNKDAVELHKENARQHVLQNHSWEVIARDFEAFYKAVLEK